MNETAKLARRQAKEQAKELAIIQAEKDQKPVKSITINIEWRKSRMWGNSPFCEAAISFKDGTFERSPVYTTSGCGYDKESTVISDVFNNYLKYKLWGKTQDELKNSPYGISAGSYKNDNTGKPIEYRYFSGGIGTSCYNQISVFIGGSFKCVASGKTFDAYTYSEE